MDIVTNKHVLYAAIAERGQQGGFNETHESLMRLVFSKLDQVTDFEYRIELDTLAGTKEDPAEVLVKSVMVIKVVNTEGLHSITITGEEQALEFKSSFGTWNEEGVSEYIRNNISIWVMSYIQAVNGRVNALNSSIRAKREFHQ